MKTFKSLIACISLVLISQGAFAQDAKIGVINALQALFNSDAARVLQEELDQDFALDTERGQELSEELTALSEKFQQDEAVMTEEEIRRMQANAQDLQVQLQLIQERLQQGVQERQQQFLESMQPTLAAAVTDVVAEGGYDLILNADTAPYFASVLDITAKVTAKLNEQSQAQDTEQ